MRLDEADTVFRPGWDRRRTLVVATSMTPTDALGEMAQGLLPQIDYLALANHLSGDYLDYNAIQNRGARIRQLERKLRLDFHLARHVTRLVRSRGYEQVFSMSERVGIPLAFQLPATIRHVVLGHHLLSPRKLRILAAMHIPNRWSRVLVFTNTERDSLERAWPGMRHRIDRLPNAVDTCFFQPDGTVTGSDGERHILSVGLSYRDYPTLLAALRRHPEITAHMRVGSIWDGTGTRDSVSLPDNVRRKPFVPLAALRTCYQESAFVVLPLVRTTLLAAGSAVALQAQAMGKAVVATRTPGMEEYVRDKVTGLLVEPEDPEAMSRAIAALWHDPARAAAMGCAARDWVVASFGFDRWLERATALLGAED